MFYRIFNFFKELTNSLFNNNPKDISETYADDKNELSGHSIIRFKKLLSKLGIKKIDEFTILQNAFKGKDFLDQKTGIFIRANEIQELCDATEEESTKIIEKMVSDKFILKTSDNLKKLFLLMNMEQDEDKIHNIIVEAMKNKDFVDKRWNIKIRANEINAVINANEKDVEEVINNVIKFTAVRSGYFAVGSEISDKDIPRVIEKFKNGKEKELGIKQQNFTNWLNTIPFKDKLGAIYKNEKLQRKPNLTLTAQQQAQLS
jgi:hypothetical protein